jgi:pimeloyl-ACP methyl ester carboxylesterase
MLLPSPETQKRLDKYHTHDAVEAKALKLEWKRALRRRNAIIRSVAGVAIIGAGISSYMKDVQANQEIQAEASITIQYKGPALDKANDHKGLIFIDGFGTDSADEISKYTGAAVQPVIDGQLLSLGYNNAPLETKDIAKEIIATAINRGIDTISLVGHSAGGDVAMQVQEEIHKESNLSIESIVLVSTPDGVNTLRPARQDEIDLVQRVDWIPGVQYSSPIRFIGEMAVRSSNYTGGTLSENIDNFFTTADQVQTNLDNSKLPGMWLMFDQMLAIENANLKDRIDTIAKLPNDSVRPTIVYLGTAQPGYDPIVDDNQSAKNIATYAQKAGIPFLRYDVSGAVHTRPDLNNGYIKALAAAKVDIQSSISEQQAKASLHRITSMYIPPGSPH